MIARRLLLVCLAVTVGIAVLRDAGGKDLPPGTIQLRGAGSTFAAPLQKKWMEAYQKRRPDVVISYEAIGSGEGTKQFLAGTVDFGASDAALSDAANDRRAVPARNSCPSWRAVSCWRITWTA